MKKETNMKNYKFIRIACATFMVLFLSVTICFAESWQGGIQAPSYTFRSTSPLSGSGSLSPSTSVGGVSMSGSRHAFPSSRGNSPMEGDPFGDETIDDINNPQHPGSPIGDGLLPLLLMAAGGALWIRRRTAKNSQQN